MQQHNMDPVWDENSIILILGSFPSVKSREQQFFYAHPHNRFWRVLAEVTDTPLAQTADEKKKNSASVPYCVVGRYPLV